MPARCNQLASKRALDDDATATEEIGQYNQRARRDGAVEDHHGDALAVRKLHGAHAVAGRRQPGSLGVEGEETVARKSVLEAVKRDGREPFEDRSTQRNFSPYCFKVKFFTPLL
jgi:hypothetical protein